MTNPPDLVFIWFDGYFILIFLQKSGNDSSASCDLNNICTALTEYGKKEKYSLASDAFLKEHCTLIIDNNAISVLDEVMNPHFCS